MVRTCEKMDVDSIRGTRGQPCLTLGNQVRGGTGHGIIGLRSDTTVETVAEEVGW